MEMLEWNGGAAWGLPLVLLVVFLLSLSLFPLFQSWAIKQALWDTPNARSAHRLPTPRGAGVIFVGLWGVLSLLAYLLSYLSQIDWLLLGILPTLIGILGFCDDKWGLSARLRLGIQLSLACLSTGMLCYKLFGTEGTTGMLALFSDWTKILYWVAPLVLVWSLNSYNFMDGLDGLAGLQGIFLSLAYGWLFFSANTFMLATLCWSLSLILLAFLYWNLPKASLFMGDAGSTFLGFLFGLLAYCSQGMVKDAFFIYGILHAVFWVDASLTLIQRWWRGAPVFEAHQEHAYQCLFKLGWPVSRVLWSLVGMNLILVWLANQVYLGEYTGWLGLSLALAVVIPVYVWIKLIKADEQRIEVSA